jgi:hypothetical protein
MMRAYVNSLFLFGLLVLTPIVGSVQVQNRYSLGDKLTYAENKTSTTVNLLTGETTVKQEETIYTEHIVELDDPLTNANVEIEKIYSFVRFTPADERAARRLLSQVTRGNLRKVVDSPSDFSIGDRWKDKLVENTDRYTIVTCIYNSDEYDTEVIIFDVEFIGTISVLTYGTPVHSWIKKEVDVQTGVLLFKEEINKSTIINNRKTEVIVKKLIKRKTHNHEL